MLQGRPNHWPNCYLRRMCLTCWLNSSLTQLIQWWCATAVTLMGRWLSTNPNFPASTVRFRCPGFHIVEINNPRHVKAIFWPFESIYGPCLYEMRLKTVVLSDWACTLVPAAEIFYKRDHRSLIIPLKSSLEYFGDFRWCVEGCTSMRLNDEVGHFGTLRTLSQFRLEHSSKGF